MGLWGYKGSSLSKCVLFQPHDVLCVSLGRWIYSVLVARALLGGQPGHGLCASWAWVRVEMVHSAAANQVSWASELPWETEKLLRNRSKKKFGLDFFPPRNIPSVAELNYCAKSEMQSLQQHAHVAWKISWDSFFLGIQHTACCHYCFVSSGAPKTSYTNAILCQSSVILGK